MGIGNFATVSINTLVEGLEAKLWRAVDLVETALARIQAFGAYRPMLCAMSHVAADQALAEAADSDARRERDQTPGPLAGIPLLVEDNMEMAGWRTRAP